MLDLLILTRRISGSLFASALLALSVSRLSVQDVRAQGETTTTTEAVPKKTVVPDVATLTPATFAALTPVGAHKTLHLAVYKGPGTSESRPHLLEALQKDGNVVTEDLTPEDIRAGKLVGSKFDGFVVPGGDSYYQGIALGEDGRELLRTFIHGGGSYLGICAGSYLASDSFPWSLHIMNSQVKDYAHWARGHGPVEMTPTEEGKKALGANTSVIPIIYWQGPLLEPKNDPALPPYTEWAKFSSDIADIARTNKAPHGMMPGATAVAASEFGSGRVVCFSPHPEKTPGEENLFHHAILWMTHTPEAPAEKTAGAATQAAAAK